MNANQDVLPKDKVRRICICDADCSESVDSSNLAGRSRRPGFKARFPTGFKATWITTNPVDVLNLVGRVRPPAFKARISHRIQSGMDCNESSGRFESCGKSSASGIQGEDFPPDSKRHGLQRIQWTF